jgi:hypothetical protein
VWWPPRAGADCRLDVAGQRLVGLVIQPAHHDIKSPLSQGDGCCQVDLGALEHGSRSIKGPLGLVDGRWLRCSG